MAKQRSKGSRTFVRVFILLLLVIGAGVGYLLIGYGTPEERAEKYYQRGLALVDAGKDENAKLEFRNVFQHMPNHLEARIAMGEIFERQGDQKKAFESFNWLVEKYPENLPTLKKALSLAMPQELWGNISEISAKILPLEPDYDQAVIGSAVSNYVLAIAENQPDQREARGEEILKLLERYENNKLMLRTAGDYKAFKRQPLEALAFVDRGIAVDPQDGEFRKLRLNILALLRDWDSFEAELKELTKIFPEDEAYPNTLVQFYTSRDRLEDVELTLRNMVASASDKTIPAQRLVSFIAAEKGFDAGLEEVDELLAVVDDKVLFQGIRAGLTYENGQADEAISAFQGLIDANPDSDHLNRFKVTLARMLADTGNAVSGRALVEEVLEIDPKNTEAVKLKGNWLIDDDQSGEALNLLRSVLSAEDNDPDVYSLLARAYTREGKADIAAQMLSEAVTKSNKAPVESMRYAQVLVNEGSFIPAERILIESMRLNPSNSRLLAMLGNVYVQLQDWSRARQVLSELSAVEGDEFATEAAKALRLNLLNAQNGTDEAIAYLQELAGLDDGGLQAKVQLLQLHLDKPDLVEARKIVDELQVELPDQVGAKYMDAVVTTAEGKLEEAEEKLRSILEEQPSFERASIALVRLLTTLEREADAQEVIERGIAADEGAANLQWMLASQMEQTGDYDGAIGVYEKLYAQNSNNLIVANNLASLISVHKSDPESIDRAVRIARRFANSNNPAFQDTYGWLLFLQGDLNGALGYLEQSAEVLSNDPTVLFHLAEVQNALGNKNEAREAYAKVLSLSVDINDSNIAEKSAQMLKDLDANTE